LRRFAAGLDFRETSFPVFTEEGKKGRPEEGDFQSFFGAMPAVAAWCVERSRRRIRLFLRSVGCARREREARGEASCAFHPNPSLLPFFCEWNLGSSGREARRR
jgi:hypothetical protein